MADILKSFTSNLIRFAGGERPSADKFNAMVSYFSRGMSDISRAIGDVYDGSREDLLHSAKWNPTSGQRRNIDILNLARIIGPASNLNARMLDLTDGKFVKDIIPVGTKEFELNYEFNESDSIFGDLGILTRIYVNSFADENQYYYNKENNSIIFAKPTTDEFEIRYSTKPNEYFGGVNYTEAGFNVIPDPNVFISINENTAAALLKIMPNANQDGYIIDLPLVYSQQSGVANNQQYKEIDIINQEEYNYLSQIELPKWMHELDVDDLIPLNSLYIKDLTLGEAYLTADYFYKSPTQIEMKNASLCLDEGHEFVIVTVATDLTTSIDDLRLKWFRHTHDGTFGEERINIKNLAGIFVKEHVRLIIPNVSFSKSSVDDNHLPMYLHRIGYTTDTSTNNGNNSMLGTLLMSRLEFDYKDVSNQPVQSKDGVSNSISFGGIGDAGPSIYRDLNSDLVIKGQVDFKEGASISPNVNIQSSTSINSNAIDSIINNSLSIFEKATNIYDDYKTRKEIRYENGSEDIFQNQEYSSQTRAVTENSVTASNDANNSLDYSTIFQTTTLFDTKADLTIWKDHSDIQVRKDIENTYTLQPRMLASIPDYYRPNLNKINNSSGTFEWLVYAGEVYKNGDESTKIGCPAIGYKNLNIKEYVLPIEDDNFILEYKDEIVLNTSEKFDLPWLNNSGGVITGDDSHTHIISFGEFQQLAPNVNDINYSEFELTTQQILRESTVGSTQNVGNYNFLDNDLRIYKYKSNKRRSFNFLDISSLIKDNLKTTPYKSEPIDRIELQTVRDVSQNSTDEYNIQPYGEVVIFERVNSVDWNIDTFQAHDYWKFRNGIFTHGYFSFEQEENDDNNTPENITTHRKYPKALINENFAIYVRNTSTNKIYWLKPYFTTYNDFHMSYESFDPNSGTNYRETPFDFGENTDPYWTKNSYDYTVLGNTIRFHIRPDIISENNFTSFYNNRDDYEFVLVHSFENKQNTHQIHDNYTYIESNSSFFSTNVDSSWYTIQQSKNSLYKSGNTDFDYNKQNIVRYTDFAGHIKNAQYSGIPNDTGSRWSFIDNKNYLVDLKSHTDLTSYSLSDTYGYYPINRYLYSLPYGKEYIHSVHNQENSLIKPRINRWKDYGENSQYITILRKEPDQVGLTENEVSRRFKIKVLNDGNYNKEAIKFNLVNFHFRKTIKDTEADIKKTDSNDSYIEWLNLPNFVIKYNNQNVFEERNEDDFFFTSNLLDIENDSSYLNSNGNFTKPISVFINGENMGFQKKKDLNLSIYLKKYITINILSLLPLPKFDDSISYPRKFNHENILSSFFNFKKSIFSNAFYHIGHKRKNIIDTSFKNKWRLHLYSGTGSYWHDSETSQGVAQLVDGMDWLFEMSETLNYIFGLNFILDVKETISKDSIKLDITFEITNLDVNEIKTGV